MSFSYWEKSFLGESDLAITGGGITGLSLAIDWKERFPRQRVIVLDRAPVPFGASTRNAGFACFGSLTEIISDVHSMGFDVALNLVRERMLGLRKTLDRVDAEFIQYRRDGGFEIVESPELLTWIDPINDALKEMSPAYIKALHRSRADRIGIKLNGGELVQMADEGNLNPARLIAALHRKALSLGVVVLGGVMVVSCEADSVVIRDVYRGEFVIRSSCVAVCANAFSNQLVPGLNIRPGRGSILVSHPIPNLKFKGNLHLEEGFYYFRNVGNRIMAGGGRNVDKDAEETYDTQINPKIRTAIVERVRKVFGNQTSFDERLEWSGTMAFGNDKVPIVTKSDNGIYIAAKLSGMGVALAPVVAAKLADLMTENQ